MARFRHLRPWLSAPKAETAPDPSENGAETQPLDDLEEGIVSPAVPLRTESEEGVIGSARPLAASPAPTPAPAAASAPPPTVPRPRPTGPPPPLRARVELIESIDLQRFECTDGGAHMPDPSHPSETASARIAAGVARMGLALRSRESILDLLARPVFDPAEAQRLISDDRPLCAQLMRVIHPPGCGLHQTGGIVAQTLKLLGPMEIRHAVYSTSITEGLEADHQGAGELIGNLWSHAFTAARVAAALAQWLSIPRVGDVARAALLHDVGKLIALSAWPGWTQTFYAPLRFSDRERLQLEQDYMASDHARLGADAARAWGLPTETCLTIEQHHAPIYYPPGRVIGNRPAIAVVHLADLLCHIAEPYLAGREMSPAHLPVPGWLRILGLRDNLEAVCVPPVVQALLPPVVDRRDGFSLCA